MIDKFKDCFEGLESPSSAYGPIVPSDIADLNQVSRAIRATGAGNIQMTRPDGATVLCAFTAGETRPLRATRVWATNTTATGIEVM